MTKIHYATGGLITPERSEFTTLCKRKFPRGGSDIMQSGYSGVQNVTCWDCRDRLAKAEYKRNRIEKIESLVQSGQFDKLQII